MKHFGILCIAIAMAGCTSVASTDEGSPAAAAPSPAPGVSSASTRDNQQQKLDDARRSPQPAVVTPPSA